MSENATLEQRVAILEKLVTGIQNSLSQRTPSGKGVRPLIGSLKDHPDFDNFLKCVREFRAEVDAEESEA